MRLRDLGPSSVVKKITKQPASDALRPAHLAEFIGQVDIVSQLDMIMKAAKLRREAPEHILMTGPGGLGKTTLALMCATELGGPFVATTSHVLNRDNLIKTLTTMEPFTIIFIDEIHGLSRAVGELIYGAMEDGWIDSATPGATERIKLPPFTIIGATTLPGKLEESFKDRFGLVVRLAYYGLSDIETIVRRSANTLGCVVSDDAVLEISDRSKGIPRVANSLLRRCRDFAQVTSPEEGGCQVTTESANKTFQLMGIDGLGLDQLDQRYLISLWERFKGGPVGITNMARAVGEDENTLNGDVEPFLIRMGLIVSTPRGRMLTSLGRQHVRDLAGS